MTYPQNTQEQIPQEVDPMTARNVLTWLGSLVDLPERQKAMEDQAKRDREAYTAQLQRLEDRITEVTAKNTELAAKVAQIASENANLKSENRWLSNTLDGSRAEVRELNTKVADRDRAIESLSVDVVSHQETIRQQQRKITDLEGDILERDDIITDREKTIATLQSKIDRMVAVARDELAAVTGETGGKADAKPAAEDDRTTTQQPIAGPEYSTKTEYRPFAEVAFGGVGVTKAPESSFTFPRDGQADPDLAAKTQHDPGTMPEKPSFDPFVRQSS